MLYLGISRLHVSFHLRPFLLRATLIVQRFRRLVPEMNTWERPSFRGRPSRQVIKVEVERVIFDVRLSS